MANRYNFKRDVLPLLQKVATQYQCVPSHFGTDHSIVTEEKYSFQSFNPVKGKFKTTCVFQVNYVLVEPPCDRYEDGYIYTEDLEKLAIKFSLDFRKIINNVF